MMPLMALHCAPAVRRAAPAVAMTLAAALAGCATLDGEPRAAESAAGCARAAVADLGEWPGSDDKRAHCLAAALIARRCSPFEAALATYAKELRDLFGRGNAELADARAGHAGIRCARSGTDRADDASCCESQGY